jgi:predicted kinase
VAGWPGSGKSTLAAALAAALATELGRAAVLAMLRVAVGCPGAVLDSAWFGYALPLARELPGRLAEVHCAVPLELARARYRSRTAGRHTGHLDADRTDAESWGEPVRRLGLGPAVTVDTSGPVDIPRLAAGLSGILPGGRTYP